MSRPRPVLPGVIAMSTRRTTLRHFLLRPDADGTGQNIFLYCLAYAARKFGIRVHAIFEFLGVLDPTFAAAGDSDAALAIIERNRSFLRDYADCLNRFRRGERDVIWPAGTWKMRVRYGLPTKPPP